MRPYSRKGAARPLRFCCPFSRVGESASGGADILAFYATAGLATELQLSQGVTVAFMGAAQNAVPEYEAAKEIMP